MDGQPARDPAPRSLRRAVGTALALVALGGGVAACSDDEAPVASEDAYAESIVAACDRQMPALLEEWDDLRDSPFSDAELRAFYISEMVPRQRSILRSVNSAGLPNVQEVHDGHQRRRHRAPRDRGRRRRPHRPSPRRHVPRGREPLDQPQRGARLRRHRVRHGAEQLGAVSLGSRLGNADTRRRRHVRVAIVAGVLVAIAALLVFLVDDGDDDASEDFVAAANAECEAFSERLRERVRAELPRGPPIGGGRRRVHLACLRRHHGRPGRRPPHPRGQRRPRPTPSTPSTPGSRRSAPTPSARTRPATSSCSTASPSSSTTLGLTACGSDFQCVVVSAVAMTDFAFTELLPIDHHHPGTEWRRLDLDGVRGGRGGGPPLPRGRARGAARRHVRGDPRHQPPAAARAPPAAAPHPRRPRGVRQRPVRRPRPAPERLHRRRRHPADVPGHRHRDRDGQEGRAGPHRRRRRGGHQPRDPRRLHAP